MKSLNQICIIPRLENIRMTSGVFILANRARIIFSCKEFLTAATLLHDYLVAATGYEIPVILEENAIQGDIILTMDGRKDAQDEAYRISVDSRNALISSVSVQGVSRGIQTFRQLLPAEIFSRSPIRSGREWGIPGCEIEDSPRFRWRGMHLDVSRHFYPVEDVLRLIDHIALHRLNVLHLHLTDDQGWRIEIKKYPELTKAASRRECTLIGHDRSRPRIYDSRPYGGFYSQKDIKEIIAYAAKRCVTVVPEIDMPGHMQAAIHAYPELGCNNLSAGVRCHWGISQHILNPFDNTMQFVKDVLSEIIDMFPSEYIHVGGDEALKQEWSESPAVQKKMHEVGAKNEDGLQSWFITQMDKFITSRGRKLIGWDEILEGGLAENAAVMSWRGEEGGIKAAGMGHEVVMAPQKYTYFDHYQKEPVQDEPLAIGGLTTIKTVYDWEPVPKEIQGTDHEKYILGGQAQVWTEYIEGRDKLDYMVFPRACALSEALWLSPGKKDYPDFESRMNLHKKRLDILGINYCR